MNLEQVRAHNAFSFAQRIGGDADFLRLARKLPVMLHTNGLLATWAHLLASKRTKIAEALLEHFQQEGVPVLHPRGNGPLEVFTQEWTGDDGLSGLELRRLTAEAVLYAVWLKRAAEALCDTGEAEPAEEGR